MYLEIGVISQRYDAIIKKIFVLCKRAQYNHSPEVENDNRVYALWIMQTSIYSSMGFISSFFFVYVMGYKT